MMARRQSDGRILKVLVKSHLSFSTEGEPASDSAVTEMARIFGAHFGETLRTETKAANVRVGEYSGKKTNSGETEIWLYCHYLAETLEHAVAIYTVMNPVAVAWANRDWRRLVPGLMSVTSSVSIDSVNGSMPTLSSDAEEAQSRRALLGWMAGLLVAFLLGMAAAWADAHLTRDSKLDVRDAASTQPIKPAAQATECPTPKETPAAAAPVTLNCNCPSVRVSCPSRSRDEETSLRWESRSR